MWVIRTMNQSIWKRFSRKIVTHKIVGSVGSNANNKKRLNEDVEMDGQKKHREMFMGDNNEIESSLAEAGNVQSRRAL